MNLLLCLEALKFYKLKSERLIQVAFVVLFLINLLPFFLPGADPDFSGFLRQAEALLSDSSAAIPVLTVGNWIVIGLMAVASLFNLLATLGYAGVMVGEASGQAGKSIARDFLAGLPKLFLLLVLLIVPAVLSAFLFFIPLIIVGSILYLTPVALLTERKSLAEAIQTSSILTRGRRFQIVLQIFTLSVLISIPESLILYIVPAGFFPSILVPTFFIVLQAFAQGRLLGLLYLDLVKKVSVVIPSKPLL
jgi:hypothetical protein